MKIANAKAFVTKAIVATVAAGALLFAAPTKSQAQVVVGVRFGRPAPVYVAPARGYFAPRPVYVAPAPYFAYRRDAYIRHDEWVRAHRFERPYGHR
jgi:hypothetical protein